MYQCTELKRVNAQDTILCVQKPRIKIMLLEKNYKGREMTKIGSNIMRHKTNILE